MNLSYGVELTAILSLILFYLYVYWILDLNETMFLVIFRVLFRIIGLNFVDNFEDILYRAKLAVYETKRYKVDFNNLKEMLVAIEYRKFYQHNGVDWMAIARAMLSQCRKIPLLKNIKYVKNIPYCGGSTITQQLFRTLFIKNIGKKRIKRKIGEIILSIFWLNKILSKQEQLEIYLVAVRFDRNVFGVLAAMKHYYGKIIANPTRAQSFFLIERISVVSQKMFPKIVDIAVRLRNENRLNENDIKEIVGNYEAMIKEYKVIKDEKNKEILNKLIQISQNKP